MRRGPALLGVALVLAAAGARPEDPTRGAREALVNELESYPEPYRITDKRVLAALRRVPRHLFVPKAARAQAYADHPVPIGEGQTISQPYIVAAMTQALDLKPGEKVLEVGTGSGYQAAVLAELGAEVYSIEILEGLGKRAAALLAELGYGRVRLRIGDGYAGWPEAAPFDAVIVTCAPQKVPAPLVEQLRVGGRLVIPVGPDGGEADTYEQSLWVLRKTDKGLERRSLMPVRFVPMTGKSLSDP
ncbi:MAG: protein-L-isoaspartate(D-aspartate) O-methyltransferase [Elusimicrobia bacterium]|nr:protein-L-isoaspartate(D-aspartate) O-methyltransferase [Elusimicrobiota bacterium]